MKLVVLDYVTIMQDAVDAIVVSSSCDGMHEERLAWLVK